MEIYKDKYITYTYEKKNSLIVFSWNFGEEGMTDDNYKNSMLKGVELLNTYKVKYLIHSIKQRDYFVSISMQEWLAKNVLSILFQKGIVKMAIIKSSDTVTQVAAEQAVDEVKVKEYGLEFFKDEQKAREWLLN